VGPRLPHWLRKPQTAFAVLHELKRDLRRLGLHTVCESARCPNIHECFLRGAATFMILGDRCTRGCGFCSVPKARRGLPPPDPAEPAAVARMAAGMRLRHVVVTSVNRDDLADGGAGQFAAVIRALRQALPEARLEVLTPDFQGDPGAVSCVLEAGPAESLRRRLQLKTLLFAMGESFLVLLQRKEGPGGNEKGPEAIGA